MAFDIALFDTIDAIPPAEWDALARGLPESWAYLRSVEHSAIPGFELFYVTVREAGVLLACAPAFLTDYPLETTIGGPLKTLVERARRLWPSFLTLKLASLGCPVTEWAALAVAPDRPEVERARLVGALIEGLQRRATARGLSLLAIKDAPDAFAYVRAAATAAGFAPMESLPEASIDLSATPDEAAYWARLSKATRKDMRRKLKAAAAVRVERVTDIVPFAARIDALYASTRARSDLQFEVLDHRYFQAVLDELGEDAALFLFKLDGEIIAFTLLVERDGVMIDKYFCADERGPALNLYFVSWMHHIRYALSRDVRRFEAGQSLYEPKLRLGCTLEPTTIYFRHSAAPVNALLKLASRMFAMG